MNAMGIGLFVSLFAALCFIFVPGREFDVSPATVISDKVKSRAQAYLTMGSKQNLYAILNYSPPEIMKKCFTVGGMLGLLGFIAGLKFSVFVALIIASVVFVSGFLFVEFLFKNEYTRWKDGMNEGIPTLVNFMPSFLEVPSITPREALIQTITFLPEPLRTELFLVANRISRTGQAREALKEFAEKADDSLVDAICFRLSSSWDTSIGPDIFADLGDQIQDKMELSVSKNTSQKGGLMALVCVLSLVGALLIFGFPGFMYLASKIGGGIGG